MVDQLAVFDEKGTQIGMTFPKRARQLVSKQRAIWQDDAHTSIRLLPETKEEAAAMDEFLDDSFDESPGLSGSDDLLLYLARKNVKEKRNLNKHVGAYILAWPVVAIIYYAVFTNTRHSAYWQWRNNFPWALDELRFYLPEEGAWLADHLYWSMLPLVRDLNHPAWYFLVSAMLAWGIWIVASEVKRATRLRSSQMGKAKLDPVQLEYKRLKDMSSGARQA